MSKLKTTYGTELTVIGYCITGSDCNTYRTKPPKERLWAVIVRERDGSTGAVLARYVTNFEELPNTVKP